MREVLPTSHTSSLTWHQPARGTDEALPSAASAVKNDGEAAAVYAQRAGKPLLRLAATTSARQAARGRARREVLHARNVETLARRIKQAFTGKSTESLPQRWRTQPRRARTSFLATGDGTRRDIFFVQNVKLKKKKSCGAAQLTPALVARHALQASTSCGPCTCVGQGLNVRTARSRKATPQTRPAAADAGRHGCFRRLADNFRRSVGKSVFSSLTEKVSASPAPTPALNGDR